MFRAIYGAKPRDGLYARHGPESVSRDGQTAVDFPAFFLRRVPRLLQQGLKAKMRQARQVKAAIQRLAKFLEIQQDIRNLLEKRDSRRNQVNRGLLEFFGKHGVSGQRGMLDASPQNQIAAFTERFEMFQSLPDAPGIMPFVLKDGRRGGRGETERSGIEATNSHLARERVKEVSI